MARSQSIVAENDPNPGLRAELMAAKAVLDPRIEGMDDLIHATITSELVDLLQEQIYEHTQRRDLIQAVLERLDDTRDAMLALRNDGYPADLTASAPALLFAEMTRELAAIQAAVAVFSEQSATLKVNFGEPVDKP